MLLLSTATLTCNFNCHLTQRLIRIFWGLRSRRTWVRVSHLTKHFLSMLFRHCEIFFANFLMSAKGPLHFLLFCNWMDVRKSSKGPPFYIFRHNEIVPNSQILNFQFLSEKKLLSPKDVCLLSMILTFCVKLDFQKARSPHTVQLSALWDFSNFTLEIFAGFLNFFPQLLVLREVLLSPVGEKLFSSLMRIAWGKSTVKLMNL